jgi:hypothetical protein
MESHNIRECPVYDPNLRPLALARSRLRSPPEVERQMRWDYSVYCNTEAGDSMARTGHCGDSVTDSEEFALQGWCEHLQETYERFSRCPPRSANGVDFHAWACTLG